MSTFDRPRSRRFALASAALAASSLLAACGRSASKSADATTPNAADAAASAGSGPVVVEVGANAASTHAATPVTLTVAVDQTVRAELPEAIRQSGKLVIGLGALPSGSPPLNFIGDDKTTLTGSEPDIARLVAAVLGLTPVIDNATWDNLFLGIDSGRTDVGFSNITDTEKRKEKYDFASYRKDNLGFEVLKSNAWDFDGNYENLAGQTVAVGSGTNQEKILLEWQAKLKTEGKTLKVVYYPDLSSTYLALDSGRITASFGPNPGVAFHVTASAASATPTRSAGTFSGAGASLQGLIAATTKKGNGLAKPVADAINVLIKNGDHAKWLAAWNLSNEAVPTSLVNPPGLPWTDS